MSSTATATSSTSRPNDIDLSTLPPILTENPYIVLTHDIIRNTKTLHYTFHILQPLTPNRVHSKSMRGYFGIMNSTDDTIELNGNGARVCLENKHHLWEPKAGFQTAEPLWHLRVSVLKDQEGQGDCPSRYFTFKSKHHLTHAANQLEAAFTEPFDIRKCGCEFGDAMGGRVNDGRCENITIEYETETAKDGWKAFLGKLQVLEDEWAHEEASML
ncbi:hypothetical protein LSUE1_G002957 [Lachnellula suecica]|uniref:Uncharacterized protein n=1 Tax=Lachnellula suecica TaxID=602035 RepID=A0A8T9CIW7_9HELO|nr:hypothetical protein LSUE1_G002957 [Lachnellula suecica]